MSLGSRSKRSVRCEDGVSPSIRSPPLWMERKRLRNLFRVRLISPCLSLEVQEASLHVLCVMVTKRRRRHSTKMAAVRRGRLCSRRTRDARQRSPSCSFFFFSWRPVVSGEPSRPGRGDLSYQSEERRRHIKARRHRRRLHHKASIRRHQNTGARRTRLFPPPAAARLLVFGEVFPPGQLLLLLINGNRPRRRRR